MKKTIITLLVVALVASASIFATVNPADVSLNLNTTINGINKMALTNAALSTSTEAAYGTNAATANLVTSKTITSSGTTGTIAYLNILTNKRTGFKVTIDAAPLASSTSGNSYKINYVLTAGTATYDTSATSNSTNVITGGTITGLKAYSYAVSAVINSTEYAAALEDTYSANVKFTYAAQ
jgi:hypothetical protein